MLEAERLFNGSDDEGLHNNRHHVNEMVGLLGEPPEAFLRRSPHARRLFDETGRRSAAAAPAIIRSQALIILQENGVQSLLLLAYRWSVEQKIFKETAKQRSLTSCSPCFVGCPRKGKLQGNSYCIPGYQKQSVEAPGHVPSLKRRFQGLRGSQTNAFASCMDPWKPSRIIWSYKVNLLTDEIWSFNNVQIYNEF